MFGNVLAKMNALQKLSGISRKNSAKNIIRESIPIPLIVEWLKLLESGTVENFSSFNPNGFFKIRLAEVGKTQLRLHIWDPETAPPEGARVQEDAHDHRWSLYSRTLCGVIQHTKLGVGKYGDVFHKFAYKPRGAAAFFTMENRGQVLLKQRGFTTAPAGVLTAMDAFVIHRASYPSGQLTATLLITDEDRHRQENYIFATDEVRRKIENGGGTTPSPKISVEQAKHLVQRVIQTCVPDLS
jgi:hypothetical protein